MDKGALAESCFEATSRPFNISGLPAISVSKAVHISQVTHQIANRGEPFDERTVLQVAYRYSKSVAGSSRGR